MIKKVSVLLSILSMTFITFQSNAYIDINKTKVIGGLGYENVEGLDPTDGGKSLFARIGLKKDYFKKGDKLGFELAVKSGFYGVLDLTEAQQDLIGGPSPVVYSGPRLELLTTAGLLTKYKKSYVIANLGFELYLLKFDRCDLESDVALNLRGGVGFETILSPTSNVSLVLNGSLPTTSIVLDREQRSTVKTPFPNVFITLNWILSI